MKFYVVLFSLGALHFCNAMDQKPEQDLKEVMIRIDQLEKQMKLLQTQQQQQSFQQPSFIEVPQNQPIQSFNFNAQNERMQNVERGIEALAQGQPYRAWHYFAAATGGITTLFSVIYIIMWCVEVYGKKTTP